MSDQPDKFDNQRKNRRHLKRLPVVYSDLSPFFFITVCAYERHGRLCDPCIAEIILRELENAEKQYGWLVGRFVIMPDHLHFFCYASDEAKPMSEFMKGFKRWTTRQAFKQGFKGIKLWQREFFDHLLRCEGDYLDKFEYLRMNPVVAELCEKPEDWKWQGVINILQTR